MSVRIIIDSSADIAQQYRDRVTVLPLLVRFGDQEYLDGVELDKPTFYTKMAQSDRLPTTSQGTPAMFQRLFDEVQAAGDSAVVIALSSTLSGTYQSAVVAAADYENIYVVDSMNATTGSGILVEYAVECAEQGMEAQELAAHITEMRDKVRLVAVLDTLENLKKGGRISSTVAFVGGLLNIKPVVALEAGHVVLKGKARGNKQGNRMLLDLIREAGNIDYSKPVLLGCSGVTDVLLQKFKEETRDFWGEHDGKLDELTVSGVIGTHVGANAVVVSFFSADA